MPPHLRLLQPACKYQCLHFLLVVTKVAEPMGKYVFHFNDNFAATVRDIELNMCAREHMRTPAGESSSGFGLCNSTKLGRGKPKRRIDIFEQG